MEKVLEQARLLAEAIAESDVYPNKKWFEREHPNRYAQIKDKINSVKHGDLK